MILTILLWILQDSPNIETATPAPRAYTYNKIQELANH